MWVWVAREMWEGYRGDVQRLPGRCASLGKQSQLLLQPTEVELGWQVGVAFDNNLTRTINAWKNGDLTVFAYTYELR